MSALSAILVTAGVVFGGLATVAIVLTIVWLLNSYGVDRLLTVTGVSLSAASLLFPIILHFRTRRRR